MANQRLVHYDDVLICSVLGERSLLDYLSGGTSRSLDQVMHLFTTKLVSMYELQAIMTVSKF